MHGLLGSGKRDVHEIEILGRILRWLEEGLGREACDKHVEHCLKPWGLSEWAKTANSATVKPEEVGSRGRHHHVG